jgi:hypothetical protein
MPVLPALHGDTLTAEILTRDTALGSDWRMLSVVELDRRILLEKLAAVYEELGLALDELEKA